MARKRYKLEEIVAKLRQVEVLVSQGQNMVDAIRQIGVRIFSSRCAAPRLRKTRTGCPRSSNSARGIFIHFDEGAIREWLAREATRRRHDELMAGYGHWCTRFSGHAPHYPGTAYVLLHSLSHTLMAEIALDCGYPASSLKERVYALSAPDGAPERCGILIYTATAGAQGTLGGLVGTAPRFAQILESALERSMICSNDPICADHQPGNRSGDRATHGTACHGCLLIAETSCEMRNLFWTGVCLCRRWQWMAPRSLAFQYVEPQT